jgi:DNA modification methylase
VRYLGTVDLPLAGLAQFPGNARRGDLGVIRASVARHGQYRSIVVRQLDDGSHVIVAGNHTALALAAEGHESVRADVIECDEGEARRINLADNRLAELGGYDDQALADLLASLDGDFGGTGWAAEDLAALLKPEPGRTDPDDVPEPPAEPATRPGDVWILGQHRLLCGDATDMAAVEEMLGGERCDCMWTDPPYGVDYVGKTKDALTIRNDGAIDLPGLLAGAFAVATVALVPGGAVYIAHPPGALSMVFTHAFVQAGWQFRQNLVWVKNTMVLGHTDYHYSHEPILFGYTPGEGRRGRGGAGWYGDNSQVSVFQFDKPSRSEQHPTMKPVALVMTMLANSCPPGGLVYEPFGGSGSTLIAAHRLGMRARVVELDPVYCDVICRRFADHSGIEPELESRASVAV